MLLTTLGPGCTKFKQALSLTFSFEPFSFKFEVITSCLRSPEILDGRVKTLHPKVVWIFLDTQTAYLSDASRCRFMVACLQLVVMLAMRRTFCNSRSFWSEIWRVAFGGGDGETRHPQDWPCCLGTWVVSKQLAAWWRFVKVEVVNLYPFQEAARSLIASEIIVDGRFYDVSWGGQGRWLRVKLRDGP